MNEELTLAIDVLRQYSTDRAWFIPVLLEECDVPTRSTRAGETLQDLQYVELYRDWDAGIKEMLDVIQPRRVSELMEELKSPFVRVRANAAHELGKFGKSVHDTVDALMGALQDENETVRANAAYALGEIREPVGDIVPALLRVRASLPNTRYDSEIAALALARIGESAVPALIEALKDKHPCVRGRAASVLEEIGKPAVPALIDGLSESAPRDELYSFLYGFLYGFEYHMARALAVHVLEEIATPEALKAVEEYEKQKKET
jgi:HEAT repeat protein